jgi:hypothetical protein
MTNFCFKKPAQILKKNNDIKEKLFNLQEHRFF